LKELPQEESCVFVQGQSVEAAIVHAVMPSEPPVQPRAGRAKESQSRQKFLNRSGAISV